MTALPDRLTRLARALAVATTRPPMAMADACWVLKNPLNGSGGATKGARYAANAKRRDERAVGRSMAMKMTGGRLASAIDYVVVLTRVSPKAFDDDNLGAAFKSVRDGMAEAWGLNDADPRVTWVTDWRKGKAHAVEAALWVVPSDDVAELCRALDAAGAQLRVNLKPTLVGPPMPLPGRFVQDFDADDYNGRPTRVVVHGGLIQRREVRVTPNVVRAKGGA